MEPKMEDNEDLQLQLLLRNDDEVLYAYVNDLADSLYDGDFDHILKNDINYDNWNEDYDECFLYAISCALETMFKGYDFSDEEFTEEYKKLYERIYLIQESEDELEEEEYE
jgi:hypothetical protein